MLGRLVFSLLLALALVRPARAGFFDSVADKVANKVVKDGEQAAHGALDRALEPRRDTEEKSQREAPPPATAPSPARVAGRRGSPEGTAARAPRTLDEIPGWTDEEARPACKLLTDAEVQAITGERGYTANPFGDAPGEGMGGGSSCNYGGPTIVGEGPPMLYIVLIPPRNGTGYYDSRRNWKLGPGCKRERAAGVGKEAYFESCPNTTDLPLYVKAGAQDLVVALRMEGKAADPSTARRTLIAVASAAAKKIR